MKILSYAKITQMSLCARPGQLFPGILQRITSFLNVVVSTACSTNHLSFNLPQFYDMLPQEEVCKVGLLERKKRKKEKEKEKSIPSVLYVRRTLQELAAQEEHGYSTSPSS